MTKLSLPSAATLVLGLLAGLLTALIHAGVLHTNRTYGPLITYTLLFIGLFGVGPLLGAGFRTALHLPTIVVTIIGIVLAALIGLTQQSALGHTATVIIITIVTVAGYLGFSPAVAPTPTA